MRTKTFKYKRRHSSYHKKTQKKSFNKQNQQFDKCRRCIYFPRDSIVNTPYVVDEYGVKHRDMKYLCLYDLHEITPKNNVCPRGACNGL